MRSPSNDCDAMLTNLLGAVARGRLRVLDLSHPISNRLPQWPGDSRSFEAQDYARPERDGYFTRSFWMLEHYGTHLDAPAHFPPGHTTVEQIEPRRLFCAAAVIEARAESESNADYALTAARLQQWEREHGAIPRGAIVVMRTGWPSRLPDDRAYLGLDSSGVMHHPGFSAEAVHTLIERGVNGLAIDTMSVDPGAQTDYAVHKLSHAAGLFHVENLTDLSELPEAGAMLIVAPIKLEGGSGGACRVFALSPF